MTRRRKGGGGKKKPPSKTTKNLRLAANKRLREAFLAQIALKLLVDVVRAAKARHDPPTDPPKDPPK
jgi:hypothetical protein